MPPFVSLTSHDLEWCRELYESSTCFICGLANNSPFSWPGFAAGGLGAAAAAAGSAGNRSNDGYSNSGTIGGSNVGRDDATRGTPPWEGTGYEPPPAPTPYPMPTVPQNEYHQGSPDDMVGHYNDLRDFETEEAYREAHERLIEEIKEEAAHW
jgi:hypothetical protein